MDRPTRELAAVDAKHFEKGAVLGEEDLSLSVVQDGEVFHDEDGNTQPAFNIVVGMTDLQKVKMARQVLEEIDPNNVGSPEWEHALGTAHMALCSITDNTWDIEHTAAGDTEPDNDEIMMPYHEG